MVSQFGMKTMLWYYDEWKLIRGCRALIMYVSLQSNVGAWSMYWTRSQPSIVLVIIWHVKHLTGQQKERERGLRHCWPSTSSPLLQGTRATYSCIQYIRSPLLTRLQTKVKRSRSCSSKFPRLVFSLLKEEKGIGGEGGGLGQSTGCWSWSLGNVLDSCKTCWGSSGQRCAVFFLPIALPLPSYKWWGEKTAQGTSHLPRFKLETSVSYRSTEGKGESRRETSLPMSPLRKIWYNICMFLQTRDS